MLAYNELLKFVLQKHDGQYRRDKITPYIVHPLRMAQRTTCLRDKRLCLAHDLMEDTNCTEKDLSRFFTKEEIEILQLLTWKKEQKYEDYIVDLGGNGHAIRIKKMDIEDNLSDNPTKSQKSKYEHAYIYLGGILENKWWMA